MQKKKGVMIDTVLTEFMQKQLGLVRFDFIRYKYNQIDWNLRMAGLVGPRGVGKSTLFYSIYYSRKNRKTHCISLRTAAILRSTRWLKWHPNL